MCTGVLSTACDATYKYMARGIDDIYLSADAR